MSCRYCGVPGHNRRTCNEKVLDVIFYMREILGLEPYYIKNQPLYDKKEE